MHKLNRYILSLLCLLLLLVPRGLIGQSIVTGDITGTVTDPSGASVPGAQVTAKSESTGESFNTVSGSNGQFRFPLLRPGYYTVTVNAQGFQAANQRAQVNLGQVANLNIQAGVAAATTTVDVTADAPLINTDNANIATTYSQQQIENLPAPGGDLTSYAFSAPGVTINSGGGFGNFSAYGLPSTSNLYTLNGNDYMDPYLNLNNSGASNLTLGANEVQEVAVVENAYSVQYGRQVGAQVNTTTKAGTNRVHGNASYWYNGSLFNANDWFNNNTGTPRPKAISHQWADSIGGPIIKDKLFFFVDNEGLRYITPGAGGPVFIPTPAFASFVSGTVPAAQQSFYQNMFNIYAGAPGANRAVPVTADVDPTLGCGSFAGGGFGAGGAPCSATFRSTANNLNTEWLLSTRIDWNISPNNRLFGRYKTDHGLQATGTDPINPLFNANSVQPQHEGQLNFTHIFSPTTINQFILSGLWYSAKFGPTNLPAALQLFPTTFTFSEGLLTDIGGSNFSYPQGRNNTQYQVVDDLSKTMGSHDLKFGVNFRRNDVNDFSYGPGTSGLLTFNSFADFATGNLTGGSTFSQSFANIRQVPIALYSLAGYAQDQWKPRSTLTINYGLRVDRNSNPSCQRDCFSRLTGPFAGVAHDATAPYNQVIRTGLHNAFPDIETISIQPRLGIAWNLAHQTVLRTGIGLFTDLFPGTLVDRFITQAPNVTSFTVDSGTVAPGPGSVFDIAAASNAAFQSGFANGATFGALSAAVPGFAAPNYSTVAGKIANPKALEYNMEIQQGLGRRATFSLNYVGHYGFDEFNQNPYLNAFCTGGTCPFGGVIGATTPDPRFGQVNELNNHGYSNYNGLTPSLKFRAGNNFQGSVSYTWSHAMDTCSNNCLLPFQALTVASIRYQIDPTRLSTLNYSSADYDARHQLNVNYVLSAPARPFGNGFLNSIFGGWTMGETIYYHSPYPFSVVNSAARAANLGNVTGLRNATPMAEWLGVGPGPGTVCSSPTTPCLDQTQFVAGAAQTTFGNVKRNSFRGQQYFNSDVNVTKNFHLTEAVALGFGGNLFNIFNHPNFDFPVNNVAAGNFGQIVSTVPPPTSIYGAFQGSTVTGRVIQLNAHVNF